ncbi:hypothetical protein Fcan01_16415 [Folsomia candida]|uniref:Uncharacterized protein n=1 Tax=Folsomia candida TaxID=158441 RepID=A0A226DU71_FOLCA|nr:hypothetical protein Fcan01_16415 [Folsomia candida]
MLTELFVQKFRETVKKGNLFSYPLIWDDKRGKLCVSQWHHANAVVVTLGNLVHYRKGDVGIFNLLHVVFYALIAFSIGGCIYSFQSEDVARVWRCGILYGRTFRARYNLTPTSPATLHFNQAFLKINRPVNFIINMLPFIISSHMFIFPRHPVHFPNIYPPNSYPFFLTFLAYPPIAIFGLVNYAYLAKTLFQGAIGFIMLILPLIQDQLRPTTHGNKCSTKLRHHPADIALVYRALQLIMKEISLVFGNYLPAIQSVFGQLAVTSGYTVIGGSGKGGETFTSVLIIVCVPFAVLSWAVMLSCAANLDIKSRECIQSWKRGGIEAGWSRDEVRYMAKFRKSCKPIDFNCQGMMRITKKTVIKFVQGIVRGIFRMLLALKKK